MIDGLNVAGGSLAEVADLRYQPTVLRDPPNVRAAVGWIRRLSCVSPDSGDEQAQTRSAADVDVGVITTPRKNSPRSTSDCLNTSNMQILLSAVGSEVTRMDDSIPTEVQTGGSCLGGTSILSMV